MLTHLSISHLAIVEDAQVEFKKGFNVLTGETGAGKSILIGAISLLAGKKASSDSVRQGEAQAFVEGVIELSKDSKAWKFLDECGITCEDEQVIIKRIIASNGKNKVLLNQQVSTVGTLSKFSQFWLDVTGQHAQQKLMDPLVQVEMLDQAGNYQVIIQDYKEKFSDLRTLNRELQNLLHEKKKAEEEKDFLTFQFKELEAANLQEGELEDLQNQYNTVKNAKEISDLVGRLVQSLTGETGSLTTLEQTKKTVESLSKIDKTFEPYVDQVESFSVVLEELASEGRSVASRIGLSQREVDELNSRISLLQSMEKKHGSIALAIQKRDALKQKLDLVSDESDVQWQLEEKIKFAQKNLVAVASSLSSKRKSNAKKLSQAITNEVQHLGMADATIEILLQPWQADGSTIDIDGKNFHSLGAEQIIFMFAPNVGEGVSELSTIASGGEISRVMLAIKSIAIQSRGSFDMTYLFDEVDSGIGGQTAERIGQRMKVLASRETQVLSVTHLAQVAAYGDRHAKVRKETKKGRTTTQIEFLDHAHRREELARMIGGIELTKKTFDFATELLEKKDKETLNLAKGQL